MTENGVNHMPDTTKLKKKASDKFLKIMEGFVDDFINICHPKSQESLLHLSQLLLHRIHTVFPPSSVTKYGSPDPISEEKLEKGEGM